MFTVAEFIGRRAVLPNREETSGAALCGLRSGVLGDGPSGVGGGCSSADGIAVLDYSGSMAERRPSAAPPTSPFAEMSTNDPSVTTAAAPIISNGSATRWPRSARRILFAGDTLSGSRLGEYRFQSGSKWSVCVRALVTRHGTRPRHHRRRA